MMAIKKLSSEYLGIAFFPLDGISPDWHNNALLCVSSYGPGMQLEPS
jgi:hypothetical protein